MITIIREQPHGFGTKSDSVMNWADLTNYQAWKYYWEMDEKEAELLEQKADELTVSCLYIKIFDNPEMFKTISTQFVLFSVDYAPSTRHERLSKR